MKNQRNKKFWKEKLTWKGKLKDNKKVTKGKEKEPEKGRRKTQKD